ncbi:response regulator [Holophaga foetida]|uniref:response regulator n=1 Tax=Holophaga foetida TaxID=35839 RepID=UPI0002475331|nr:HD domain-containing phosphohydrolase [Holophaga foetida]
MELVTTDKILLVDDDENVLQGYFRNLRRHFSIEVALGGESALQALESHGPFAVVVADMRMPGMTGLELLKSVRDRWPEVVRIMLTGNADQGTAADAVNQGEVFRFLSKPCDSDHMRTAILAALRQYHLTQAEKILLERTLMGSIRVLTDLLGLLDPEAYGRSQLIRERVRTLGTVMGLENTWELEMAAMLSPIGLAVLPRGLAAKCREKRPLSPKESALVDRAPEFGANLLENIPRMGHVAQIIRLQAKQDPDGTDPLEARILRGVTDFTLREQARKDAQVVIEDMKLDSKNPDLELISLLERHFTVMLSPPPRARALPPRELKEGMVLAHNVEDASGQTVLLAGLRLGPAHLDLLNTLQELRSLEEPVHVLEY